MGGTTYQHNSNNHEERIKVLRYFVESQVSSRFVHDMFYKFFPQTIWNEKTREWCISFWLFWIFFLIVRNNHEQKIHVFSGFKWIHLSERLTYERAVHHQKLQIATSKARKEANFFQNNLDKSENLKKGKKLVKTKNVE